MILQTRREFRRPTWVAYVDFRAAFDSVNRQFLWLLLRTKGVPQKLIDLLEDLYTNTVSCVRVDRQVLYRFSISVGVRQGCAVAPDLFLEPIEWIISHFVHRGFVGVSLGQEVFTDLDFADDVSIMAEMLEVLILALKNRQHWVLKSTGTRPRYKPQISSLTPHLMSPS